MNFSANFAARGSHATSPSPHPPPNYVPAYETRFIHILVKTKARKFDKF